MGQIRKQAIISSIVIYIGFFVGFINTWLFTKNGIFLPEEYALTRLFFDVGQIMYAVASLGSISVIYKFFPYYKDNLAPEENDLATWVLVTSLIGFLLVIIGGLIFEPLIVQKFSGRSPLFVNYYKWVFPFGLGLLLFTLLETLSNNARKTIYPSFLRETGFRLITTLLIVLFLFNTISFDLFIKLFAFSFLVTAFLLAISLVKNGHLPFTFKMSRVTKKFKTKMLTLAGFVFSGQVIYILAQVMDSIFIASLMGLIPTGIFALSSYIANLIQIPQRSMISITLPALSQAWKDKNMHEIERIYKRSSINLLLAALFIFGGIWLNIEEAFRLLDIQSEYTTGLTVIFILSISRIIDAGTGVNSQILMTSTQWKFEFLTGVLLLSISLPLNYVLIKKFEIEGSAYANLISFSIYNLIRYFFLWKRFQLQPFSSKTVFSIVTAVAAYFISFYLFQEMSGWMGIILRSAVFTILFFSSIFAFKLTPDAMQLLDIAKKRFKPPSPKGE
ncbi:MAG: polysaccharide biosynthesis C-terminal domain-containing protein [Chitinophagaceae bacterium]|jgi:O-antigen/teichoic acid export membrane protein|nr:polysaccharide biosynthesis C-terminal domain-containing protein [Chitinophagaceae bacterium]